MSESSRETLGESLLTFIELAGRNRFKPDEIANDLHTLAKLGADWPKESVRKWKSEISTALTDGRLSLDANGDVFVSANEPAPVQLLLF